MKQKIEMIFHMLPEAYKYMQSGRIRNRWLVRPKLFKKVRYSRDVVNTESGEITREIAEAMKDCDQFSRLYDLSFILHISRGAQRLVVFALERMQFDGMVTLSRTEFESETGISKNSFYKYKDELIDIGFMYYESKQTYFINPNYIAKGRRHFATIHEMSISEELRVKFNDTNPSTDI